MRDLANAWLIDMINVHATSNSLWLVDENFSTQDFLSLNQKSIKSISNRWDLAQALTQQNINAEFSDFDTSNINPHSLDAIFFRVSKEKPITHHIINGATQLLKPGGKLFLAGYKNEGIKTYIEKTAVLFGSQQKAVKQGESYCADIALINPSAIIKTNLLTSEDYSTMRVIAELDNRPLMSKPGQFGWNKLDVGSALLIRELKRYLLENPKKFNQCLDLGCGYGYLSLACADLNIDEFTLTDNNAAALISAQINTHTFGIHAQCIASDAGNQLSKNFDLIVCNPPFHQGFNVETDLTDKFLANAKRLLAHQGSAFFVVNQFIGLENKAAQQGFSTIKTLCQESGFKVVLLEKYR